MKITRKLTGLAVCLAVMTAFAACGKNSEEVTNAPETTTEVTTAAGETTEETTTAAETEAETTTKAAKETTTAVTSTTAGTTAAAQTTTTAAATTKAAEKATENPAATTAAKAADPAQAPKAGDAAQTTAKAEETTAAPVQADTTEAPAPATEATTEAPTDAPAPAVNTSASELLFEFGGASLNIGDNAQSFVGAVPPNSQDASVSCYGNGEDINYYYDDFTLYIWNENGNYMTYGIDITGTGAQTSRGITIGSSVEDVKAAYGTGYEELGSDYVYTYGEFNLHFTIAGNAVTAISYNKDI